MNNKSSHPILQPTITDTSKLQTYLQTYYGLRWMRVTINFIYVINEVLLALYLLFIPIQISYYWLLSNGEVLRMIIQNSLIQTYVDTIVLILFIIHILLYFDEKFHEIMKNPYAIIWKKIITIEFIYDLMTVILAIYAVAAVNKSLGERVVEVIFLFKIYKLVKFDQKAMYFVIGTDFYILYKVIRTLLIVFMAIAFVGSLFYGVAYIQYVQGINVDMLWIVNCGAISECVEQPFIIQLEYAMYWALGTASTAAYGDISATQPTVMIVNILALAFEGFLFGFYLNSMHSIPLENQKKQSDLLQKFDSFQQHSSNRILNDKLYLQILCSLEYTQTQKRSLESIEKVMPKKYIQQIKYNIYKGLLDQRQYFFQKNEEYGYDVVIQNQSLKNTITNTPNKEKQFLFTLSDLVVETVCELGENVYDYNDISHDSLLFVKEGNVIYSIFNSQDQVRGISSIQYFSGDCFGLFGFFTGLSITSSAICSNYSIIYSISGSDFKSALSKQKKIEMNKRFHNSIIFEEPLLRNQPIMNYIQSLELNNCELFHYNFDKKFKKMNQIYNIQRTNRLKYRRENIQSKKMMQYKQSNRKNQQTQTQILFEDQPLNFIDVYDSVYDQPSQSLQIHRQNTKIRRNVPLPHNKKMEAFMIQMQVIE